MVKKPPQPVRLYVKGAVLGYKRGLRTQNPNISLIKIQGVDSKEDTQFYLGKRVAYITKCATNGGRNKNKYRVNWGRVCRAHGGNGVVRCRFRKTCLLKVLESVYGSCCIHPMCKILLVP